VDGVADDGQEVSWNGLRRFDLHKIASSFRIVFDVNSVFCSLAKLENPKANVVNMMVGPLEL
jgi:hypothetical protein